MCYARAQPNRMPASRKNIVSCFLFAWFCAATIGPIGDHYHVATGVTEYFTDFGPIWFGNSPLWFVLLVTGLMAPLAVFQGLLGVSKRRAADVVVFSSPVVVLAAYLLTSFYPWREGGSLEAIMVVIAVVTYRALDRTRFGLVVGAVVAIGASMFEWMLVQAHVFRYLPESDEMFGVAPWLLPLYFTASVAVGAVGRRWLGGRDA